MIPVTCAIIHNFIRMVQVGDPILEEYAANGVPMRQMVCLFEYGKAARCIDEGRNESAERSFGR
ncbi:hypothetical protein TIFTF001_017120 [Ficus carica]|uniref:Uncharacterized protein n=1 Tax=Ficus carica TaxID=3494 RepID=A0AA88AQ41_FICCA|nr:hypothetical protein TIFTF001_017120 [Ficus carica]